ncbi:C4-dicarboxylate transporter DctQ subunit [Rhodoligotrophos appendicifer]|uniref:TRAP transporter small permease n=1 Tax=Rhodoligotrophos appendicifer TaxID=987056 RepID=UPI00117CE386|nr:TRAP transporter small permease [Rhodoligotrophos appendicifer]
MGTLAKVVGGICAVFMLVGIGVNFANVVGRYVFAAPFTWAEDFLVYANIWLVFLGAALISFQDRHLSMDLLRSRLSGRKEGVLSLVILVVSLVTCGIVTWISAQFVLRVYKMGQESISLEVPMYLFHSAVLVGFSLISLALVVHLVRLIRNRLIVTRSQPTEPIEDVVI